MYKTWFMDELEIHLNDIENIIKSYHFPEWLLAHEEYNKQGDLKPHYHILVKLDVKESNAQTVKPWNNLLKKLKTDYKLLERNQELRKKNPKGGATCFGVPKKELYDIETFKRYLCKDGNVRSSMTKETLDKIMQEGQSVKWNSEWRQKVLDYVENQYKNHPTHFDTQHNELEIKTHILDFYIKEKAPWCASSIKSLYNYVISYSTLKQIKLSSRDIILRLNILSEYGQSHYHKYN